MSEQYKEFAKETYTRIELAAADRRVGNDGKPVLIISAGSATDSVLETGRSAFNDLFKKKADAAEEAAKEEPAMASAYAHVAAIKAAEQLFDKKNVLVSFQCSPEDVKKILKDTKDGKLGETLGKVFPGDNPMAHAFRYAHENGYQIVGSDVGKESAIERANKNNDIYKADRDEQRYETERNALNMMGTVKTGAVVHITDMRHLPVLIGMKYGENPDYQDNVLNPYENVYGLPLIINSDDRNSPNYKSYMKPESGLLQIDAPGRMDESDKTDIGKRIDDAARKGVDEPATTAPPKFRI
ncbi:MAG: hypothetical protein WBK55_07440 [Alphaproteobacteria bacterium]